MRYDQNQKLQITNPQSSILLSERFELKFDTWAQACVFVQDITRFAYEESGETMTLEQVENMLKDLLTLMAEHNVVAEDLNTVSPANLMAKITKLKNK